MRNDIEEQLIAFPQGEPNTHVLIRSRYSSGKWWIIIGFQSEERVRNIVAEIKKITTAETEIIEHPLFRLGKKTGPNEDVFLIVFVNKTTLNYEDLIKVFQAQGIENPPPRTDQDLFPISAGYHRALFKTLEAILEQHTNLDN